MPISTSELLCELKRRSAAEGLSGPRVTPAHLPGHIGQRLDDFLAGGRHGTMDWMAARKAERKSPGTLWPKARSALIFAQSYTPDVDPMKRLQQASTGVISVYALNRDYHDVFKGKLKRLAQWFHQWTDEEVKVFVDTAPLMEKPLAEQAGLGWQGKHTNLVSRDIGSWFFIGTMLTTAALPADLREADHCGSCTACLNICPTRAFPAPRQLDARRCISYLTIEHKGHIAPEFRHAMGNRVYGCDDCLAVCPWNKFAKAGHEAKLQARVDLLAPRLTELLKLDDPQFRRFFAGSPVKRVGRDRFIRNCLIAAGNSGDATLVPVVETLLADASPLVRAMAVWALSQLQDAAAFRRLRTKYALEERDADVASEWQNATA